MKNGPDSGAPERPKPEPEQELAEAPEPVRAFLQQLSVPDGGVLSGLPSGAVPYAISRLLQPEDDLDDPALSTPLLVVTPTGADADQLAEALRFHLRFLGARITVCRFPADDVRTFGGSSPHPDLPRARIRALHQLLRDDPVVVVASARALMHRVLSPEELAEHCLSLSEGTIIERDDLLAALTHAGYLTAAAVEEPGTVSVRGGTVDVWPTAAARPLRLSFFDDEIEEIRPFDPSRRQKFAALPRVEILPAREAIVTDAALIRASEQTALAIDRMGTGHATRRRVLSELKEGLWFPGAEDYLPALHELVDPITYASRCIVVEPEAVQIELRRFEEASADRWTTLPAEERPVVLPELRYATASDVSAALTSAITITAFAPEAPDYGAHPNDTLRIGKGDLGPVVERLRGWQEAGWQLGLVCDSKARAERITALLSPHGLQPHTPPPATALPRGLLSLLIGTLPAGFHAPRSQVAWITADELFGRKERARRVPRSLRDAALASFTDLKADDLVVHVRHGIGRFIGLKRLHIDGRSTDCAEISYRSGDRLYLPVTRLDQLYRYRAMGDRSPKLDKLGSDSWERRKQKVSDRVLAMAAELLALHASRAAIPGRAYPGEPPLFQQFVETFPYVETPDQDTAIQEVLDDLARPEAMDRLIVGDVGFGKTEVAMRAAMRVVLEGRQVAILCPTTVLAFQHDETFRERFEGFPVEIRLLSRFRTPAQTRAILKEAASGEADILIGTAALLSRKLRFKDLGLVIIDEEHRFGVRQKERLKKLSSGSEESIEYLAMSATPIPRTLHMALSGLRGVSMIATPPAGRTAVRTHVIRYREERVREHILHELKRGGQVFYIHNRVASIERTALHLQKLVPEASI
ncbi:MAG: transcription-repair coupling factor (superfamily II helicase), partial [Myxococcota bacterium]